LRQRHAPLLVLPPGHAAATVTSVHDPGTPPELAVAAETISSLLHPATQVFWPFIAG